jgi:hypothetical protein
VGDLPVRHHLITGLDSDEVPRDELRRGTAALGTVVEHRGPRGDEQRERSSARLARTSCGILAPCHCEQPKETCVSPVPSTSVSTPKLARLRLKTVRTFARMMLAQERLVGGHRRAGLGAGAPRPR